MKPTADARWEKTQKKLKLSSQPRCMMKMMRPTAQQLHADLFPSGVSHLSPSLLQTASPELHELRIESASTLLNGRAVNTLQMGMSQNSAVSGREWMGEDDDLPSHSPVDHRSSTGQRAPLLTGIEAPSVTVAGIDVDFNVEDLLETARPKSGMRSAFMNMANSIM